MGGTEAEERKDWRRRLQRWWDKGGGVGGGRCIGSGEYTGECGEESGGARLWTHSATSVTQKVCVAPPRDVYRKVKTQPAWS